MAADLETAGPPPPAGPNSIRFDGVEVRVGAHVLLAPTTFDLARGARLSVVGASGAGKSTLLRLALGLVFPSSGLVRVFGRDLTPATAEAARLRMGYVVQEGGLFPHLRAGEGAAIVARHLGWPPAKIEARLRELGTLVGIPPGLFERYPFQLSGGQRQRVGIVRALLLDPEILLFDEPFAALDPISAAQLEDDLLGIVDRLGKTLLFVTHDVAQAGRIGHEVAVMHEGRIVQRAPYALLERSPAHPFVTALLAARRAAPTPTAGSRS